MLEGWGPEGEEHGSRWLPKGGLKKITRSGRVLVPPPPSGAYDPDDLKQEILEAYVKSVGVENAFGFHCYKALPVSFAARGNDLVTMHKWVLAILAANRQGSLFVSKCLQQRSSNIHLWQQVPTARSGSCSRLWCLLFPVHGCKLHLIPRFVIENSYTKMQKIKKNIAQIPCTERFWEHIQNVSLIPKKPSIPKGKQPMILLFQFWL